MTEPRYRNPACLFALIFMACVLLGIFGGNRATAAVEPEVAVPGAETSTETSLEQAFESDAGFDWARRFDEDARALMRERPQDIASLAGHRDYRMAVPTDEHFLPLLYVLGTWDGVEAMTIPVDGIEMGSLSMLSVLIGA